MTPRAAASRYRWLAPLLLLAVIAITFSPALRNRFVDWDDQSEIYQNPDFNPVTWSSLAWNWRHTRLTLYMPITYAVWGGVAAVAPRDAQGVLEPGIFHGLNLVLHAACTLLVLALLLRLGMGRGPALVGALVFAVHPIQTEAVVWASGMYTLLSAGFCLGAILLYLRWTRWAYLGGTACYAAGLLTKASSAAAPLMAAVLDWTMGRRPVMESVKRLWLWAAMAVPLIVAAKRFQDLSIVPAPPWWGRPIVALDTLGWYVRKIVWPVGLCPDYGRTPDWVMGHLGAAIASGAIGAGVIAIAIASWRRRRWVAAGVGLLVAGTLPYSGLTTFDFQYVSTVTDRYAYLGMVGVALLAAGAAGRNRMVAGLLVAAVVVWGGLSFQQARRWHDTDTLMQYTLATNPHSLIAQNILGYEAQQSGHTEEAQARYRAALATWPADATIHYDLANLLAAGNPAEAAQEYALAVRFNPGNALYHNNWGVALARLGNMHAAATQFAEAIQLNASYADAHANLGLVLSTQGRKAEAAGEFDAALRIDPNSDRARRGLQQLNHSSGGAR